MQFQFAPATEKVPAQYDDTEQINSIAVLHVLLGLAIFCAMYLCCVLCLDIIYHVLCFTCKIVRLSHSLLKAIYLT